MKNLKHTPPIIQLACCLWLTAANASNEMTEIGASPSNKVPPPTTSNQQQEPAIPIQTTELPDKLNVITDSLSSDNDIRYYSFVATRGQRVILNQLNNPAWGSYWVYEYKIDGDWIQKHTVSPLITAELKPGQKVEIRVSKHPTHPPSVDGKFQFEFGSAPYLTNHLVSGDASYLQVYLAAHKSFTHLSWSGLVKDSTGHPVEGATIIFEINKNKKLGNYTQIHRELSDSNGTFSSKSDVGKCSGTVTSPPFRTHPEASFMYTVSYNPGYWHMYIRGNENSGVGSKESGDFVSFAHVCSRSRA